MLLQQERPGKQVLGIRRLIEDESNRGMFRSRQLAPLVTTLFARPKAVSGRCGSFQSCFHRHGVGGELGVITAHSPPQPD